ncbi:MAG: peptidase [Beggiatoa sp. IS2]|nr:MAG: peptidase [Beggiatoa sp. IS2]
MIKGFKSSSLGKFYYQSVKKGISKQHTEKLARILDRLNQASDVQKDMRYPGSELHKLEPKNDERWAVKVDKNWRITFIFKNGDAYEVDYIDYH